MDATHTHQHMDPLWDPERLRNVGHVLTRYSAHLAEGDRIRLGMEGDPCTPYRSADDAPRATVTEVTRDGDHVRFRAQVDGSDELLDLDNRNVSNVWEIDPDYLDTFRSHVEQPPPEDEQEKEYRSAIDSQLERLEQRLEDMETTNRAFRETMASTVRALAGDMMRSYRGGKLEFAHQYADRYDLAIADRAQDNVVTDSFRGDGSRQAEKETFDLSRGSAYASSIKRETDSQASD